MMASVSPQLRQLAAKLSAQAFPPHVTQAQTTIAYRRLLSAGECWWLTTIQQLSGLSEQQWQRLHEIEARVERNR